MVRSWTRSPTTSRSISASPRLRCATTPAASESMASRRRASATAVVDHDADAAEVLLLVLAHHRRAGARPAPRVEVAHRIAGRGTGARRGDPSTRRVFEASATPPGWWRRPERRREAHARWRSSGRRGSARPRDDTRRPEREAERHERGGRERIEVVLAALEEARASLDADAARRRGEAGDARRRRRSSAPSQGRNGPRTRTACAIAAARRCGATSVKVIASPMVTRRGALDLDAHAGGGGGSASTSERRRRAAPRAPTRAGGRRCAARRARSRRRRARRPRARAPLVGEARRRAAERRDQPARRGRLRKRSRAALVVGMRMWLSRAKLIVSRRDRRTSWHARRERSRRAALVVPP